jgi:hypothetical protein
MNFRFGRSRRRARSALCRRNDFGPSDRHSERFVPEFGSLVRGEAIAWRRKGVRRANLKIVASDPDLAAIEKALGALNNF